MKNQAMIDLTRATNKARRELEREDRMQMIKHIRPQDRGEVGYANSTLIQGTWPYRDIGEQTYTAKNGNLSISMTSINGIPYGVYPRLIMCWLVKAAQMNALDYGKDNPDRLCIHFGNNLTSFMRELGIETRVGKGSTSARLREQLLRMFSTTLAIQKYDDCGDTYSHSGQMTQISKVWKLHWDKTEEANLISDSYVVLSEEFFDMLIRGAVPVDMGIIRHIESSPMALDLFMWLSYRFSYLRTPTAVTIPQLMAQFGTRMDPEDCEARRNFVVKLKKSVAKIHEAWPEARITVMKGGQGVLLRPTAPSVSRRAKKDMSETGGRKNPRT